MCKKDPRVSLGGDSHQFSPVVSSVALIYRSDETTNTAVLINIGLNSFKPAVLVRQNGILKFRFISFGKISLQNIFVDEF